MAHRCREKYAVVALIEKVTRPERDFPRFPCVADTCVYNIESGTFVVAVGLEIAVAATNSAYPAGLSA